MRHLMAAFCRRMFRFETWRADRRQASAHRWLSRWKHLTGRGRAGE
jgi:hypothetical protein